MSAPLLVEIGTEELPPRAIERLSAAFSKGVADALQQAGFEFGDVASYATPRRLAVLIADVPESQPDREVERKGPALKAAFDDDGNPTKAVQGFARSCGVAVEELQQQETDKGTWLVFRATEQGKALDALIEDIIAQVLNRLPVPKRMRWGDHDAEFVRPVHWVVVMHGSKTLPCQVMGIASGNATRGHRFHANQDFVLEQANDYASVLREQAWVMADVADRKAAIREQVVAAADAINASAVIDDDLLAEVTALNEWPVAVTGQFEAEYLEVPAEALIKTMQDNQKYFPVVDGRGELLNYFITISNIDSSSPEKVKAGNERVVRPRLSDAKFFWEQDQKKPLQDFAPALENIVFQEKLGTLADKTRRVEILAAAIAERIGADQEHARRAASLCKCDLLTDMVGEFAALQGIMGRRYAEVGGEPADVAIALEQQYMPRGASDTVPDNAVGQCVAIADKLDTLTGIFAIGQKPTGEKDPFALRRAALGILRTIIECELDLDLAELISLSADTLQEKVDAGSVQEELFAFMLERLRAYYHDRGVSVQVFDSVSALQPARPHDFDKRIRAVQAFTALPEAESLAAANKRVGNILKKTAVAGDAGIDIDLFEEAAENTLYNELLTLRDKVEPLFERGEYETALCKLSVLRQPVDDFFDSVMVMADDDAVRNNRVALLNAMSNLFMQTADLSRLQG